MVFRNSDQLPLSPLIMRPHIGWCHSVVAALGGWLPVSQGLLDCGFLGLVPGVWVG